MIENQMDFAQRYRLSKPPKASRRKRIAQSEDVDDASLRSPGISPLCCGSNSRFGAARALVLGRKEIRSGFHEIFRLRTYRGEAFRQPAEHRRNRRHRTRKEKWLRCELLQGWPHLRLERIPFLQRNFLFHHWRSDAVRHRRQSADVAGWQANAAQRHRARARLRRLPRGQRHISYAAGSCELIESLRPPRRSFRSLPAPPRLRIYHSP